MYRTYPVYCHIAPSVVDYGKHLFRMLSLEQIKKQTAKNHPMTLAGPGWLCERRKALKTICLESYLVHSLLVLLPLLYDTHSPFATFLRFC